MQRVDRAGLTRDTAVIEPGDHLTVTLDAEGDHDITYFAVDLLGNREPANSLRVRSTAPPRVVRVCRGALRHLAAERTHGPHR